MWGLEGQIGTLTAGADGTFVLLDGDPLDVSSRVLEVWMRGIRTYDRTTDERLQRLTEGR
jgi:imidazolonepropionase-like amidohydrolase